MQHAAMMIGAFSRKAGVTPDTVRYYEREGLLAPARGPNNYRIYGPRELARMELIGKARLSGFTLSEIRGLLGLVETGRTSCGDFQVATNNKLAEIDERIRLLQQTRTQLVRALESCPPAAGNRVCRHLPAELGGVHGESR